MLAAKLVQYDNDEKTWLEFRFTLENYLTLVDEKYVALLQDAESQAAAKLPAASKNNCSDHPNVESHIVRLVGDTDFWTKLETGAKGAELKWVRGVGTVGGRERTESRAVTIRQSLRRRGSRGIMRWMSTKIFHRESVVLREAPQKLRDHLLVNSQQFESNYNKLRAIIHAYLNTNKTCRERL